MNGGDALERFADEILSDFNEFLSGLPSIPPETRLASQLLSFTLVAAGYLLFSVVLVCAIESRSQTHACGSTARREKASSSESDK